MAHTTRIARTFLVSLPWLVSGAAAFGCTVCFGGADSDLARGFAWGIIFLGSLPFILMSALIASIYLAIRKNQKPFNPAHDNPS